jgi:hypothetical protein
MQSYFIPLFISLQNLIYHTVCITSDLLKWMRTITWEWTTVITTAPVINMIEVYPPNPTFRRSISSSSRKMPPICDTARHWIDTHKRQQIEGVRNGERERENTHILSHWVQVASQLLRHLKTQFNVQSVSFDSVQVRKLGSIVILWWVVWTGSHLSMLHEIASNWYNVQYLCRVFRESWENCFLAIHVVARVR